MKRFFKDPQSIAIIASILIFSPLYLGLFLLIGSPFYFSHQENSQFQQNLKTVLECRKSVEIAQMDKICGPIPQRGDSK
jgi:hypothetical protein